MKERSRLRAAVSASRVDLLLLLVALFWGASYLAAKTLLPFSSFQALLGVRFSISAVIMLAIWAFRKKAFSKTDLQLGSLYGLMVVIIMLFETNGIKITSATNAGLIISLTIIFTPIIESAWRRSWLPKPFFYAATAAVIGVGLLVSGNGFKSPNLGDALMLIAAVLRAGATASQGMLSKSKQGDSFNITTIQVAFIGLVYLLSDVNGAVVAVQSYGPREWLILGFLSVFCTVFGFVGLLWAIRRTSASRASLLNSTEPIWAVIVAVLIGGETLAWLSVIGAIVIIGSTYIGQGIELRYRAAEALSGPNRQS